MDLRDEAATQAAMVLVKVQNVTKSFGTGDLALKALDDVSLTIKTNEFFTLLGPSGCGKTTLLRLLAGFEHPTSGVILLDNKHVADDPPNKRPVNTVFQSYALFPHMTVEENVAFGLQRLGQRGPKVADQVGAMLRLVRLETLAKRRPDQLSGGQQQRVALARALAPQPRLLLLDEPLSALDLKLRRGMQIELKRIQRETGITFVLVTHDQEEALSMSDRIAVMNHGRVLQLGRPEDIYKRPVSRFVADFIGEANVLPGSLVGLSSAFAAIRPEHVVVSAETGPGQAGLAGRVIDITYLGATTSCAIALADGTVVKTVRGDLPPLAPEQAVTCVFPSGALLPLEA
ncbi:ABC transporter ATP-binding protein [Lichenihabitans sp. PAMC28606]|uniref:ABC transporter ATP-binding protein n=1 Tax=Lichenihabitans sp. PAMC28606 TaxID=2880932 RepID=UPI0039B40474